MTTKPFCDVIVVGAGPVGLVTALLVREKGQHVKVFERHPRQFPVPRAVSVFHQGLRTIHALGLYETMKTTEALSPYVVEPRKFQYISGDECIAEMDTWLPMTRSGLPFGYGIHQPTFDSVLEKACVERGVEIHRSTEVSNVVDHGSHVEVIHGAWDPELPGGCANPTSTTASFVIGCDGSNSRVREATGIENFVHKPAMSRWLVVDVLPKDIEQSLTWRDTQVPKQYLGPSRPTTSVPAPAKRRRWEFMLYENEGSEEACQDPFIWNLLADFGPNTTNADIERKTVYSIRGAWAKTFAKGRVALAGDAAHQAPQFLGQGLNSGLRDAVNLAWRLNTAIKHGDQIDWEGLLQEYSAEQLPITEMFVRAAKGVEASLVETDLQIIAARNAAIKKNGMPPFIDLERVGGLGTHVGDGKGLPETDDAPGRLFIQGKVKNPAGQVGLLDTFMGRGWALYVRSAAMAEEVLSADALAGFTKYLEGKVVAFGPGCYEDVAGVYNAWFEKSGNYAVLVRPDYYIFGCAKDKEGIEELVQLAVKKITV